MSRSAGSPKNAPTAAVTSAARTIPASGGRRRVDSQPGGVGADREEAALAEADLAGEADQDVQADRADGRDADVVDDCEPVRPRRGSGAATTTAASRREPDVLGRVCRSAQVGAVAGVVDAGGGGGHVRPARSGLAEQPVGLDQQDQHQRDVRERAPLCR